MTATHVLVQAKYEERIRIHHLAMHPSLQGASCQFGFENHQIEIRLPTLKPNQNRDLDYMEAEADVWQSATNEILEVHIYAISVSVVNLEYEIPTAAADIRQIDSRLYSDDEARALDKYSDEIYFLSRRAVEHWLRVVRWKAGLGLIDVGGFSDSESMSGGRLYNLAHGGSFYSPRVQRTVVAPRRHCLSPETWQEITSAIAENQMPPIWNEYHMSSHRRIDQGDLAGATIDLAIAVESVIRTAIDMKLPQATPKWMRDTVARINMSTILDRWNTYGLPAVAKEQWFSSIRFLIEARNGLMHRGDHQPIKAAFCRDAEKAVKQLVALVGT